MAELQQMECRNCGGTKATLHVELDALNNIRRLVIRCDCGVETTVAPRALMEAGTVLRKGQKSGWWVR